MRIVLINTTDTRGGAAVACNRLLNALNNNNVSTSLLVKDKYADSDNVTATAHTKLRRYKSFFNFAAERLSFACYEQSKSVRFAFSPANTGEDISTHPLVREADVIHLHWINFGFLSLSSLKKLFALNKPVVWTMHDMWSFTGGCHYAGDCRNFITACKNCYYLKNAGENDLSNRIFKKKKKLFEGAAIQFVGCSAWLANIAAKSKLIANHAICNIPNPIDIKQFFPDDKLKWSNYFKLPEQKKMILFGAANINDVRKGYAYFKEALEVLAHKHPQTVDEYEVLMFGKSNTTTYDLPYKVHQLPYISGVDIINGVYNCADVFVLPSLEDNLPNTVMEASSCGLPVVAFDTGGIPEMIVHKETGFISNFKSASHLAEGIQFVLGNGDYKQLCDNARNFVLDNYSEKKVAAQYQQLYEQLIEKVKG